MPNILDFFLSIDRHLQFLQKHMRSTIPLYKGAFQNLPFATDNALGCRKKPVFGILSSRISNETKTQMDFIYCVASLSFETVCSQKID
jgi:hypothetical protein